MTLRRPLLRYYGSKFRLAKRIIEFFPTDHRLYTEVYGGGAGVLLNKSRSPIEVYNDLDGDLVGLFRILQRPAASRRLVALLRVTPYARQEYELSLQPADNDIEAARRLIVRSFMGYGSNAHACSARGEATTGFRSYSKSPNKQPAREWATYPDGLLAVIERLRRVVIECRDASAVLDKFDDHDVLHYIDPPYLPETRERGHEYLRKYPRYRHELSAADHKRLLDQINGLKGMVVLSGYPAGLYEQHLKRWKRFELTAFADGARPRTEVVWINRSCAAALRAMAA